MTIADGRKLKRKASGVTRRRGKGKERLFTKPEWDKVATRKRGKAARASRKANR